VLFSKILWDVVPFAWLVHDWCMTGAWLVCDWCVTGAWLVRLWLDVPLSLFATPQCMYIDCPWLYIWTKPTNDWHSSLVIYCRTTSPQPSFLGRGYQGKMREGMGSYSSAVVPLLFYVLHMYHKYGVCNIWNIWDLIVLDDTWCEECINWGPWLTHGEAKSKEQ